MDRVSHRTTRTTAGNRAVPRSRRTVLIRPRLAVLALAASLLLSGCTGGGQPEADGAPADSGAPAATPTAEGPTVPVREAREGWKVFSDPSRQLSFELPEAWVVQPLQPEPGVYAPESLHYAVRTPEGTTVAEVHSGIVTQEEPCPDAQRAEYFVIGSEPLALTEVPPASTDIEPRFVVRLITGFRFFGAYGVTDQVGGADGLACSLTNTVDGGGTLGRVSFGDLEVLAPKAPANTGPQTVSFGTIGEAEAYYETPEFTTIREMISSLQLATAPAQ